jgi:hypothetical protein
MRGGQMDDDVAKPIFWPVWTQPKGQSEVLHTPIGHEATEFKAFGLLQTHFTKNPACLCEKTIIGVERTAQGWFPILV